MAKKEKRIKPAALATPPELGRIAKLRDKLVNTDRDDHLKLLDEWEVKVKNAAILLNLQGHEGIQMIIERAEEEIRNINEVLRDGSKPKELSPEAAMKYTMEQFALHEKKELWVWFRSLFTDAEKAIKEVGTDLDNEEEEEVPGY